MFIQLDFVNKICSNFDYWSNYSVLLASLDRYEKFMRLMGNKSRKLLVPTIDVDLVWHSHQTHPTQYNQYCLRISNKFIDHDDTVGAADLEKGYARYVCNVVTFVSLSFSAS